MHQPLRKRMLTRAQFVARFKAEKVLQQLRYCKGFALWRKCPIKRCRRDHTCRSDEPFCMVLAHLRVPRHVQIKARQEMARCLQTSARLNAPRAGACRPTSLWWTPPTPPPPNTCRAFAATKGRR
jgi:hypothetical protein